jgi:hypothetical protein
MEACRSSFAAKDQDRRVSNLAVKSHLNGTNYDSVHLLFWRGGVGKTTMACAHAVRYADEGKRT